MLWKHTQFLFWKLNIDFENAVNFAVLYFSILSFYFGFSEFFSYYTYEKEMLTFKFNCLPPLGSTCQSLTYIKLGLDKWARAGFIQASLCKIQGLFKDSYLFQGLYIYEKIWIYRSTSEMLVRDNGGISSTNSV